MIFRVSRSILGALLIWFGGCEPPERIRTPVLFVPPYDQPGLDCLAPRAAVAAADAEAEPVGILVVDIWAYNGPSSVPDVVVGSACRLCLEEPEATQQGEGVGVRCELVARQCLCGGPWLDNNAVGEALTELQFSGLPGDKPLCVRLVGLPGDGEPSPPGTTAGSPCTADVEQCTSGGRRSYAEDARICVLSELSTLGNGDAPVLLDDFHCARYDSIYKLCQDVLDNVEPFLQDIVTIEQLFGPEVCNLEWAIEVDLCELFPQALDVLDSLCEGYTDFSAAQCAGPLVQ